VLAQDVEQACVGMGVIESRPPTLRTNRYSPHDESILAAKVPCAKSAAEMMDNLASNFYCLTKNVKTVSPRLIFLIRGKCP
jgi:hypothetical protein